MAVREGSFKHVNLCYVNKHCVKNVQIQTRKTVVFWYFSHSENGYGENLVVSITIYR